MPLAIRTLRMLALAAALGSLPAAPAAAAPGLVDPDVGLLELVTPPETAARLNLVDGLAFDRFGNLFAALEIPGPFGGLALVAPDTGEVAPFAGGIGRADQVAVREVLLQPDLAATTLVVTSEVTPAATSQRLFEVGVSYDADGRPLALGPPTSLQTLLAINNPEGLVVLAGEGPFGAAGTLYVAEDLVGGRVLRVDPDSGAASVLAAGLRRPEGLAFGDFDGAAEPALYAAETGLARVIRIGADGGVSTVGAPAAVGLVAPDNVEFGPDGFLYVTEDRPAPLSRILRIAADGTHEVFATGFGQAAGLAFHPWTGDLYVSEQDFDRIWRVRFRREVALDVRPGSPRNRVRPGSHGVLPVAILGSELVDVGEVDPESLAFGPGAAAVARVPGPPVDLDHDGYPDLRLLFRVDASGIAAGDAEACLEGALFDGRPLGGCDEIESLPPGPSRRGAGRARGR
jgi:sugar lactone lactonase YvrE